MTSEELNGTGTCLDAECAPPPSSLRLPFSAIDCAVLRQNPRALHLVCAMRLEGGAGVVGLGR